MNDRQTIVLDSGSEAETQQIAERLAENLDRGDVVALEGPLGSGKTCFVRGLASGLGIEPKRVSSPTFVICHEYEGQRWNLAHVDAYRLSGADELDAIGWTELLEAPQTIIAVEWPSRVASALPARRIDIALAHAGEHKRTITITAPPKVLAGIEQRVAARATPPPAAAFVCRTCGKTIARSTSTFPFCSARCKMADLGKWFSEGYRVSRELKADDELSE